MRSTRSSVGDNAVLLQLSKDMSRLQTFSEKQREEVWMFTFSYWERYLSRQLFSAVNHMPFGY